MHRCLLCDAAMKKQALFTDIFLLKEGQESICVICQANFEKIGEKHCKRCFKVGDEDLCLDCIQWEKKGQLVDHESLYCYNEAMADYFSRYKFQGDYLLRKVFEKEIRLYLSSKKDYALVPIPLSPKRQEERRFNQVTGLLEGVTRSCHFILEKKEVEKQSAKNRQERLRAEQPFCLKKGVKVPEMILLVDDIYTTGATICLAKEVLMKNGAKKIKSFSLAR